MNLLRFRPFIRRACNLMIILFAVGLVSCNKDDASDSNPIVGIWQLSSITYDGEEEILSPCDKKETVEFKANNTYIHSGYYSPSENGTDCTLDEDTAETGTWSLPSKGKIKITSEFENESYSVTVSYSISGNKLTITSDGVVFIYTRK